MAIIPDLSQDKERGPGYGRLRIRGLRVSGPFDFALMRNRGAEPYLGHGATWQATEVWHAATAFEQVGNDVVIAVGPEIVDPIVNQPASGVAYLLVVATGTGQERGTLVVVRPLLSSDAAARESVRTPAPAPPVPPPPPRVERPPVDVVPPPLEPLKGGLPPPAPRWRAPVLAAAAALAVLGAGAGAWYGCLLPGFGAAGCSAGPAEPPPEAPREAKPGGGRSCEGLDAPACLEVARAALAAGDLEAARQLFQQAGQLGSVEANNAVARMYDPVSWSAETSPISQADWETAVYWYETAARKDDLAGKLGAGRLLCDNATTDFERKRGLAYLRAAAGSADAQALISACEAKGAS